MPDERPLTPRQQRFVEEYLKDCNGAAAYRRAGYRAATPQSAAANSARLIAKDNIASAIAAARAASLKRVQITADDIRHGLHTEACWHGDDSSASARVAAWRELGKLMGFYPAEGIDLNLAGRLELVEEVVTADADHDHKSNGQIAPGTARLPPQ